jgi:hypothetical protein
VFDYVSHGASFCRSPFYYRRCVDLCSGPDTPALALSRRFDRANAILETEVAMTFHHPYRLHHRPTDAAKYGFAFVRRTLNAIAILILSATLFIGFEISSVIHGWT